MKNLLICFIVFTLCNPSVFHAQKPITLEDIWGKYTFRTNNVPGFNFMKDGKHYSTTDGQNIIKNDLATGQAVGKVYSGTEEFEDYAFNSDESQILLATQVEEIYRRSSKAFYKVWNGKTLTALNPKAKQINPTFNAQGTHVAFTSDNNLYINELKINKITQATNDGVQNKVINGLCDWVYEEEFSFTRAYEWSPDGSKIAFLRFDESAVPEFTYQTYDPKNMYPTNVTFKYPKVGQKNSVVSVWLFDLKTQKLTPVQTGASEYFPRLRWTPDNRLIVFKLNRLQNELELMLADAKTGKATGTLLKESRPTYIDVEMNNDLSFLKDGSFIKSSEVDGWNHIYHYDKNGKLIRPLTKGAFDVRKVYGVDEANGEVFYQASKISPIQKEIYFAKIDGSKDHALSPVVGDNEAEFSSNFSYFVLTHSTANTAPTYTVYDNQGKEIRIIEDNKNIQALQNQYGTVKTEFFKFKTMVETENSVDAGNPANSGKGVELNGWMMKPANFDATKKYPVFMTQYSGPNSQRATDEWGGQDYWWYQYLTQKGYIVVCVDGRGTGGRGEAFRKITYKQLGHYETIDQIEAAKWLGKQPYVDATRIGIFGWSYGAYMSSLCILKGNDVFKTAIAVAPVINWKWYDTIYTERFMQTDKENAKGYEDNSPINFADRLKGNYLIVHGMGDDNVHFQNSVEMVNALVRANKTFDAEYYPNKNHGIYGGTTRLHLWNKMSKFILEKL
jgi:dipeptidyl-peptidase 4